MQTFKKSSGTILLHSQLYTPNLDASKSSDHCQRLASAQSSGYHLVHRLLMTFQEGHLVEQTSIDILAGRPTGEARHLRQGADPDRC